MNLYLLYTDKLGSYYVVARDHTDAIQKLQGEMDKANCGIPENREVTLIKLVAKELKEFPKNQPYISNENTLLFGTA